MKFLNALKYGGGQMATPSKPKKPKKPPKPLEENIPVSEDGRTVSEEE